MKTDAFIGDLAKRIKQRRTAAPKMEKESDAEDHFALSLALDIRKMPEQLRCMAKNDISQVLFKHQMMMFNNNVNFPQRVPNTSANMLSRLFWYASGIWHPASPEFF